MARLATYAPNEVSVVITQASTGVVHLVAGYSEDSIVSVERNSETFSMYKGADDSATRIYNADTGLMITLSLQQTAESNDILTALYKNDKQSRDALFSILVKDNSGRSYFFAEEAYIAVLPNAQYSNSMQIREWVIHAPNSEMTIGGNARLSPSTQAALEALGVNIDPSWAAN